MVLPQVNHVLKRVYSERRLSLEESMGAYYINYIKQKCLALAQNRCSDREGFQFDRQYKLIINLIKMNLSFSDSSLKTARTPPCSVTPPTAQQSH